MSYAPSTPVTGGPQTGFTSPTYTIAADLAPSSLGKQYSVTVINGTQAGVTPHSVSAPFTATFYRPPVFKVLGKPNPTTGLLKDFPVNPWKLVCRKAMLPLAGQPLQIGEVNISIKIPAGADIADAPNVKALLSLASGLLWQQAQGIGQTLQDGIV